MFVSTNNIKNTPSCNICAINLNPNPKWMCVQYVWKFPEPQMLQSRHADTNSACHVYCHHWKKKTRAPRVVPKYNLRVNALNHCPCRLHPNSFAMKSARFKCPAELQSLIHFQEWMAERQWYSLFAERWHLLRHTALLGGRKRLIHRITIIVHGMNLIQMTTTNKVVLMILDPKMTESENQAMPLGPTHSCKNVAPWFFQNKNGLKKDMRIFTTVPKTAKPFFWKWEWSKKGHAHFYDSP